MRLIRYLAVLAVGISLGPAAAGPAQADARPTTYVVAQDPGVAPEGIAVTPDGTMYVTSVATGAVYRGNVCTPRLRPFLAAGADGRTQAAGIHLDPHGRIFVAGYSTGTLFVYATDGRLLAVRKAPNPDATLNDLAVTRDAVYLTDSVTGTLWRAEIDGARIGQLTAWLAPSAFPRPPSFLNGIVTAADGRLALVADQGADTLFRVDLATRTVTEVAVAGGSMGGDGLLLEGHRLYAAVNFLEPDGSIGFAVNLAQLNRDLTSGTVIGQSRHAQEAQTPTTIARDRGRLLWVNSQLLAADPSPPYTVTQIPGIA